MSANNNIKENVWAMQNELRNKEGITGIDAMHHVLMILLAKSFTKEQCQKLNIPEEFAFENMIKLTNKKDLYDKFYNPRNSQNCVVRYLREKDMFGYTKDLPFQIKNPTTLEFMYNKISKITNEEIMNTYDLVGDIYEHFINREGKTMKDLGQYFTDRTLIRYLVDLCNPQVNDGHIPTVWDPSAGTGGFLIEYIHHMNKQSDMIDWSIEKVNLHANDINKNTYSLLMQNLYYSLKEGAGSTINLMDSLVTNDDQMYDFILANPPFGIKGLKYADMCQKVKNLGINGTKGEILFLQLCMAKLKDNGKCAIVVPEGVLFNATKMYKETRKYLLENFNLKRVIKVGEGEFFKNTGVKTSVFFFEKSGKTENIEFIQVNKADDTIKEVPLMKVEIDKIIENDYSLNMNLYKEIVFDMGENIIEMKKVVELFQLIESTTGGTKNISGDYKFINQNKKHQDKTHNSYRVEGKNLFIFNLNSIGKCYYYDGKCEFSNLLTCLKPVDENINPKYYYYYFNHIQKIIFDNYCTSACRNKLDIEPFKKLKIPVPPLEVQNRIVEQLDNIYETEIESSKEVINSLKTSIETIMKNTMYLEDLVEYKIKDIINTTRGNLCKPSEKAEENIYPYYAGDKISGYVNTYEFSGPSIMMNYRLSLGSKRPCQYIRDGDYNCSRFSWVCTLNSDNILSYIYHYFNNIINYDDLLVGSTILEINQKNLGNYKIRIPPPEIQREILKKIEPKERLINQLEKNINRAEKEAKEIMDVLFN